MISIRSYRVAFLVLLALSPLLAGHWRHRTGLHVSGRNLATLSEEARCPYSAPGVVVDTVTPESAAFRAGLMPGDRLFSWCRAIGEEGSCVARRDLRTPFDWLNVELEDVQRGGVVVEG